MARNIFINGENSFITLKNHKENFDNNPTVRLINPPKNELGPIIKAILDTANRNIRETLDLNQWRNTETVIDWFKGFAINTCTSLFYLTLKNFKSFHHRKPAKKALTFGKSHTTF